MERVPAARVVTPDGIVGPAVIEIEDGCIAAVTPTDGAVPDRTLAPGFVDLQVNGIDAVDVAAATGADWDDLDRALLAQGVTTWCPTLVTAPLAFYATALARIGEVAARAPPPGGPRSPAFISRDRSSAARRALIPAVLIRPPDLDWLAALPPIVRLVTLAPEPPLAVDAVARLAAQGVLVAVGHSAASYDESIAAFVAGARLVTHCFNGMPALHHRAPGLVGAALTDSRVAVSLIADLVHVHPAVLALVFRAKGRGGVVLVTDAVAWQAARVGRIELVFDGAAARLPDGTLAGSSLTMDRAVANVVHHAGVPLEDAIAAASTTPAALLGLDDRGTIAPGRRADLVALGPDLAAEATWVNGVQVVG